MKVYELIKMLVKLPPDCEVTVYRAGTPKGRRQVIVTVGRNDILRRQGKEIPNEAQILTEWEDAQ